MSTSTNPNQPGNSQPKSSTRDNITLLLGAVMIVVFVVQTFIMFYAAETVSEIGWSRGVYLLTGLETIAFAAVAFFFGREVHREQAEKAEAAAESARTQAAHAAEKATIAVTKGIDLRNMIASLAEQGISGTGMFTGLGTGGSGIQAEIERLSKIASKMFP